MLRAIAVSATLLVLPVSAQRNEAVNNDQVRVLVVKDTSTAKGRMHEHAMNRVMIYLDGGAQRLEYADGRVVDLKFSPGEPLWSAAGGMHTSQNLDGAPHRIVEVELKNKGGAVRFPALDPVKVAPSDYKVLIDNPQVRVIKARIDPRGKVPLHEHALNRVVVFLTDTHLRSISKDGAATDVVAKAGDVRWSGPAVHREENLSDKPFEVLAVELKP
jgi:uncharacterized RmlC-like cupin family protein